MSFSRVINGIRVFVHSDLESLGFLEGELQALPNASVALEYEDGSVWNHFHVSSPYIEREIDKETGEEIVFARECRLSQVLKLASQVCEAIENGWKGPRFEENNHWAEGEPAYGSPAYQKLYCC